MSVRLYVDIKDIASAVYESPDVAAAKALVARIQSGNNLKISAKVTKPDDEYDIYDEYETGNGWRIRVPSAADGMSRSDKQRLLREVDAIEAEHAQFEKFVSSLIGSYRFDRDNSGQYVQPVVQNMWYGWRCKAVVEGLA